MNASDEFARLRQQVSASIVGQTHIVERLLIGLLINGNLLVEGLPGLAKTRAVKALARNLDADFSRIQFTPDLLPTDVTGTEVLHDSGSTRNFRFEPGPIFANLVLADEINRAPAKVQAALLEAMEERQVTVAGTTHALPPLFMVMATQNPIEQEGAYPLPEAQMDRFAMHVMVDYPEAEAEIEIVRLVREEERSGDAANSQRTAASQVAQDVVFAARKAVRDVEVSPAVERYAVDIIFATRFGARLHDDLGRWIQVGASPRGSLALDRASRAHAWLKGRHHVIPDDIRAVAHDCLRHRLQLSYEASADGVSADEVLDLLLTHVAIG
jgi:MoxR-like ATPase